MFDAKRTATDPFLVVGWREKGEITCRKMSIKDTLFDDIRSIASAHLEMLATSTQRDYEPSAAIEKGEEYFLVPTNVIPTKPTQDGEQVASLLRQLHAIQTMPVASTTDLEDRTLLFYAFAFQQDATDEWLTFVRKVNPTSYFRAGRWWCTTEMGLKKLEVRPTFAFDNTFDLVVDGDNIYAVSAAAVRQLFTEVKLSTIYVKEYVNDFVQSLPDNVYLSQDSEEVLVDLAQRKVSFVSRVYGLANRLAEISEFSEFSASAIKEAIDDDEIVPDLISGDEIILATEDHAKAFLDAVEGRFFRDFWTQRPRRADSYSSR